MFSVVVTGWPQKVSDTCVRALGFVGGTSCLNPICLEAFQLLVVTSSILLASSGSSGPYFPFICPKTVFCLGYARMQLLKMTNDG